MKTAKKITITASVPAPKGRHDARPARTKTILVREWAPQPCPMTREEIRKLVIDQIG